MAALLPSRPPAVEPASGRCERRDTVRRDATHRVDQSIDVLTGVVRRKRRPYGAVVSEPAEDRLCAVMTRAHRDPLAVERNAHLLGRASLENERQDGGLLWRHPDYSQTGDLQQSARRMLEQLVLVVGDVLQANRAHHSSAAPRPTASAMLAVPASKRSGAL